MSKFKCHMTKPVKRLHPLVVLNGFYKKQNNSGVCGQVTNVYPNTVTQIAGAPVLPPNIKRMVYAI